MNEVGAAARASTRDRDTDVRFVGSINGRYTLSSRRRREAGGPAQVEVFACRVMSISALNVAVTAPVSGAVRERLTAHIDGIGLIAGNVARLIPDGFVFDVDATADERTALAARIGWLKRKRFNAEEDRREHRRFLPRDARSIVTLADGRVLKCVLIDVSRSGAAVSADLVPVVGDRVVVGSLPARVIRPLKVGFAVQFDEIQVADQVERLLAPGAPPVASGAAPADPAPAPAEA
jgi:hypothetical protein